MEEYFYVSFCVAISFFIFKLILNKIKYNEINNEKNKNSDVMRDSFYIFIITFLVIYFYSNYFKKGTGKTQVFTNEPGF